MSGSTRQWCIWLAVVALWPATAQAQTMARPFDELIGMVKADETVVVTDTRGRRVKGLLTAVDEGSLSLTRDGRTETFARSEVSAVRAVDDLGNGALIGAGAGLGAALGILAIVGSGDGYVLPSAKVGAPLLLSSVGVLVGVLVDRAHDGGRVLYLMPPQPSGRVAVSPLLGKDRLGVVVSFHLKAPAGCEP